MPTKYWRGGSATWTNTNSASWSLSSGGPADTTAPTATDDVVFDSLSHAGAYTVTIGSGAVCKSITFVTSSTVVPTFTGTGTLDIRDGDFNLPATNVTWSHTGTVTLQALTASRTLNLNGRSVSSSFVFRGTFASPNTWSYGLASALTTTGSISVNGGTFNTNGFSVTATTLNTNSTSGTVNLGASTLTFSQGFNWTQTGVVLNAGTSSIRLTTSFGSFTGAGKTYNDVQFTYTDPSFGISRITIEGINTFATLTLGGFRNAATRNGFMLRANQTVTGTLTIPGGNRRACRTMIFSDSVGQRRTITAAAVSGMQNVDFIGIAAAGASAPWSGPSLGDGGNNTGITFPAPKTAYYVGASNNLSFGSANVWSDTPTGAANDDSFPVAQDTAIITNNFPASGHIVQTGVYNHGTIDMSQRTSALTITPQGNFFGDWIGGSGITISGSSTIYFSRRGAQSITSAGKAFPMSVSLANFGGTVTLQDALTVAALAHGDSGTPVTGGGGSLNDGGYNITVTGATSFTASSTIDHTLTINGTWTFPVSFTASTLTTPAGSGVLSFTGTVAKTFAGAGRQTWPTLQQAGTGTLTVTGNNKFANLTNTANGTITFSAGSTNEFSAFGAAGVGGSRITINSSNTVTRATLRKPLPWNVGTNSLVANSIGVTAAANTEGVDWLNVAWIEGISTVQLLTPSLFTNTQAFYSPTVASSSQQLVASLFTNTQTFYAATAVPVATLAPSFIPDTDAFFAATVSPGAVTLTAARFDDTEAFYAATVGRGPVTLSASLLTNTQTFYAPSVGRGAVTLTPALFTNAQAFYGATVTRGAVTLSPARFDNAQAFYSPTATATASVLPSLAVNAQAFYDATLTPGAVELSAPLTVNEQAFYDPSVQPGAVELLPELVANESAIYAPVVELSGVFLQPPRVDNESAFYEATVSLGAVVIAPDLLVNAQDFQPASVQPSPVAVDVPLVANAQAFYAPVVQPAAVELAVERVDNAQVFYEADVIEGAVNLQPDRLDNAHAFFGAGVQPGQIVLRPPQATNTQSFFGPQVQPAAWFITAPILVDDDELFTPEVYPSPYNLSAPRVNSDGGFFLPTIASYPPGNLIDLDRIHRSINLDREFMAEAMKRQDTSNALPRLERAYNLQRNDKQSARNRVFHA